ncbi:F-box protein At5g51380-like isoform X1 [Chenopodium quinoa]|uniref:F-box protein At5g51380-like isoform X1 n=1 Tax=Chenopodium quinoa TaxID=63459 RepID=UPI000B7945B4|nr:F-box protein At5g51380-like isoform X1 [Chenopodium quinoa]XP_021756335.1 F-box protein At5g51380-like isoform X1 [Chenopodium quinoa]XP_021756336.1 F-box protein At5g51380-like isoform X1 [Chenopodium quinoa]
MAAIEDNNPKNPNPSETPRKRRPSLPELWFKDQQLKHAIFRMQQLQQAHSNSNSNSKNLILGGDPFSVLSDESLSFILSKVPISQHFSNSLVCKRWYMIQGQLIRSITLFDWDFLESGRLTCRFPNLSEINLAPACFRSCWSSGILMSHRLVSIHLDSEIVSDSLIGSEGVLGSRLIDRGLKVLADGCPNLSKLALVNSSEKGLGDLAEKCLILQELEIHCCEDMSLTAISGFKNLQILKLVGCVDGLYDSVVTDIGLTMVAQGCRRLVKLELSGCEGSYDGIKAIGQCCQMLEELTLCGHKMDGGWLSALSFCSNLKTLKLQSCQSIDSCPGPDEHLGSCPTLEELHLERCQVRDKESTKALFLVCESIREISLQDCWGLEDDIFRYAVNCRRVKSLSLEGCSLLTTEGLDSVVHKWTELQTLKVVSCNSIKDSEITAELATLFSVLKELKWRPDSRSLLASSLAGTGVGKKGGRFFKRIVTMVDKRK